MSDTNQQTSVEQTSVEERLLKVIEEMTIDWDTELSGEITRETTLVGDLAFESIDIVQLVVAIEEQFGKRNFPFEQLLMVDGRYVDELSIGQVAEFVASHLSTN